MLVTKKITLSGAETLTVDLILDSEEEPALPVVARRLAIPRPTPRRGGAPVPERLGLDMPSSLRAPVQVAHEPMQERFSDLGEIARGGTAVVRKVLDTELLRRVALKVLRDERDPAGIDGQRFIEEAQITGQLEHPNIVPVYELVVGDSDPSPAMVMKLLRGRTFKQLVNELGESRLRPLNLERLVRALVTVCDAVAFAHEKGVVHCDLKPDNIMTGRHGQVYVMDWGNAQLMHTERTTQKNRKTASGTPGYMAPEQVGAFGGNIDARTDVYGIGGVLYYALTCRAPRDKLDNMYDAVMAAHEGAVVDPDKAAKETALPPELCRIAMRCLAREPGARYADADEVKSELEQFLRGGGWLATRRFRAGREIVREGDVGISAYVLAEGECEVFRTVDGERVSFGKLGPGEVFGETAILTSKPRTATVVALTDVVAKVVTRDSLQRELERNALLRSLVMALAGRFRDAVLTETDQA